MIDSLVVELGFDTSGLKTGRTQIEDIFKKLREDAEGTGKRIEDSSKKVDQAILKMRNSLLELLVAFTGGRGIKSFVEDLTATDAALGRLSRSTEMAAGQISELEGIASISGGTAQGMAATLQSLQSAAQQLALTGQSATLPYLRALHIQLKFNKDGAADVGDELMQMAKAGEGMGKARAAEMFRGAGVTDEGTINLLLQGSAAVQKYKDAIDAAGHASQADANAATERLTAWRTFDAALTTLGRNILTTLTPALTGILNFITKFAESPFGRGVLTAAIIALSAAIGLLSLSLTAMATSTAFRTITKGFSLLVGIFPRLLLWLATLTATAFPALSEAFLSLGAVIEATPIGWLITIIAALGFAAYELVEHWSDVKDFFKGMWDDIAGYFQKGIDYISNIPAVKWVFKKLGLGGETPAPKAPGKAAAAAPGGGQGGRSSGTAPRTGGGADSAIEAVLQHEDRGLTGRVTNDAGGITRYGISSKAHPGLDVANLSLADAKSLYKSEYWDAIGGDSLPAALQTTALDAAINQGVGNAKKWLKEAGGDVNKFNALRRGQYEHLAAANPEKYGKYLKGWESRIPSATSSAIATASAGATGARAPSSGAPSSAVAANTYHGGSVTHTTSEVNIGNITVVTKATDAKGIAASIQPQLRQAALTAQSQTGQS